MVVEVSIMDTSLFPRLTTEVKQGPENGGC